MDTELSWFDRLKIWVTPKSHAEALVDEVYGDGRGMVPIPQTWEPENAGQISAYVEVKQTISGAVSTAVEKIAGPIQSTAIKVGLVAALFIVGLVIINAVFRAKYA